jgi:hypothetical protein
MTSQRMTLRKWKRIQKGARIGVAGIALPFGGSWLDIDDVPILMTNGKAWAIWPGKPVVAPDGRIAPPGQLQAAVRQHSALARSRSR